MLLAETSDTGQMLLLVRVGDIVCEFVDVGLRVVLGDAVEVAVPLRVSVSVVVVLVDGVNERDAV